ncbi:rare lipoprotein A [Psychromonas sp. CNPT3]|uniref:septal ring lytic transglycosylase RlpA family protein n=1 Tax=Psychromonas sp. CNPT3 TaxID=314282 RepID=UPI00006E76BC|nr:septal ring lytic transglycosylase RlpA family protein [Psychromonas sp. CNPT3]AGH80627.1 rare lipoprotein A [Psychromonas sp. CNPT3]
MKIFNILILCISLLVLSACSSNRYAINDDHAPNKSSIPPLAHIENASPRYEPYSRGGNKDYNVRGIHYKVLKNVTSFTEKGNASWYGKKFHGHLTSNGERYNMFAMSAAHKNLPLPSYVEVTNLKNSKKIIVRVNDRGPFHSKRIIDLSYAAAKKLDMLASGTTPVSIKLLHFQKESPFVKGASTKKYYIQYLVTSQQSKAQTLDAKLSDKYNVASTFTKQGNNYRLRLGPLNGEETAQSLLNKMRPQYPGAFLVPIK